MFNQIETAISRIKREGAASRESFDYATNVEINSSGDITITFEFPDGIEFTVFPTVDCAAWTVGGRGRFATLHDALNGAGYHAEWDIQNRDYDGRVYTVGKWGYSVLREHANGMDYICFGFGSGLAFESIDLTDDGLFWYGGRDYPTFVQAYLALIESTESEAE